MTIRLLTPRGAWPVNAIVTLDAATESALVAEGIASTNLTGGTAYAPVDRTDRSGGVRYDPVTGALTVGGAPIELAGGSAGKISARSSITVIGDSIASFFAMTGADINTGVSSRSLIEWANTLLRQQGVALEIVGNRAVGSTTINSARTAQLPLARTDGADLLWIHTGVNNFNSALGNSTLAAAIAEDAALIAEAASTSVADAFKGVIISSLLPIDQGGTSGARPRAATFKAFNAARAAECAKYSNVLYLDLYSQVINPSSSVLNPITGTMQTDGIHQTSLLGWLLRDYIAQAISSKFNLTQHFVAGGNLLPTLSSGSGGTITPGAGTITAIGGGAAVVPAGWNVQVAAGTANVQVGYAAPDAFRMQIANPGVAATVRLQIADPTNFAALFDRITDRVGFDLDIQWDSAVLLNRVSPQLFINGATIWWGMGQSNDMSGEVYPQANTAGKFGIRPYKLSTVGSLTSLQPILSINVGASTGAVNINVSTSRAFKAT